VEIERRIAIGPSFPNPEDDQHATAFAELSGDAALCSRSPPVTTTLAPTCWRASAVTRPRPGLPPGDEGVIVGASALQAGVHEGEEDLKTSNHQAA
jgi:hypothetical protein